MSVQAPTHTPTESIADVASALMRECNTRSGNGLTVTLYYYAHPSGAKLPWVLVEDEQHPDRTCLYPVAPRNAADAFTFPYRYVR